VLTSNKSMFLRI